MGGKRTYEKRMFTIHNREYWLEKRQIQKEFGCPAKHVEAVLSSGKIVVSND